MFRRRIEAEIYTHTLIPELRGDALGANDAANVFGTAVETRMIPWATAAIICPVFLLLGAVVSGAGTAHTLGKPGWALTPFLAGIICFTGLFFLQNVFSRKVS